MVGTADEVELGCVPGKPSSLYIEKQKFLQGADALQGICIGKVNGMFDGNHVKSLLLFLLSQQYESVHLLV